MNSYRARPICTICGVVQKFIFPEDKNGDNTGGDNPGGNNTGGNNTGGDNTGGNNTGGDNTGGNNTGGDNTGGNNTGGNNTGGDNTGGDNTGGNNTGGDSPPTPHVHDFATEWTQGATEHYHKCNGCEETRDNAAHSYVNGNCSVCGKRNPNVHVHDFSGEWKANKIEHYHQCPCGATSDNEAHDFKDDYCTICGVIDPTPSSLDDGSLGKWPGDDEGNGTVRCDCADPNTGRCRGAGYCECDGNCNDECGCGCYPNGYPCGCACDECQCYYGYTCDGDEESCNCTCHDKAGKGGDFEGCGYLFGDEFGYDIWNGEFKVAFVFPSPEIREYFSVRVTFGLDDSRVYFSIESHSDSPYKIVSFEAQPCMGGMLGEASGTVEEGSFRIGGKNFDYCMQYDEHYYIIRVQVKLIYNLYDYVEIIGTESGYEPIIQLYQYTKLNEMELYIHSKFDYVITSIELNGTMYEFDENRPFGGFYTFPLITSGEISFYIEFEEVGERVSFCNASVGYDYVATDENNCRTYYTTEGKVKVDVCHWNGRLVVSLWDQTEGKAYSIEKGKDVGLKYKLFGYGGYVEFNENDDLLVNLSAFV